MTGTFSFSLVLVAIVVFSNCVALPQKPLQQDKVPKFQFLGKFMPSTIESSKSTSTQASYYFISQNAAAWATAETDCKAFLSPDASLVAIETEEELAAVNKFLKDSDDTQAELWLGGTYDVGTSSFLWNNEVPVAAWAPWDVGHPATSVPISRISGSTVGGIKFRAKFNTESYRYLCELPM